MPYQFVPDPDIKTLWEAASFEPGFRKLLYGRLSSFPLDTLLGLGLGGDAKELIRIVRVISGIIEQEHPERMIPADLFEIEDKMLRWAETLRVAFGSIDAVAEKRILDIACGSRTVPDCFEWEYYSGNYNFEPWFCRMVHALGGRAIGLDMRTQENEFFEWHAVDLLKPESFDCIATGSIDACHMDRFYLLEKCEEPEKWDFQIGLRQQLERILSPDARIIGRYAGGFKEMLTW